VRKGGLRGMTQTVIVPYGYPVLSCENGVRICVRGGADDCQLTDKHTKALALSP
jgi:hypothetical protein